MSASGEDDQIVLKINGQDFDGWTNIEIETGLKECCSIVSMPVSERWAGKTPPTPWQIKPFDNVTVTIGGELVLTGYVEEYNPSYSASDHNVRISARSKPCDLVDCMPDMGAGQFLNNKLDAIARAICAKFGIDVVVEADVGDPFPDVMIEKTETGFQFLEKLARQRSVLLTDNEKGNLVLTQAGKGGDASGALIEGDNILAASANLSARNRFQEFTVYSQLPVMDDGQDAQNDIDGHATDPNCPRYRRLAEMSEDPLSKAEADARAKWRKLHNIAEDTQATITVQGFRQRDGKLWKKNQNVPVKSPMLALDRKMLTASIKFSMSNGGGRQTHIAVAPPELFTLEPVNSVGGKSAPVWTENAKKG